MSQLHPKCEVESVLFFVFVLCFLSQISAQHCHEPCHCPWVAPRCAPGVPLVMDGCGCCRICARQYGESCNQVYICHHDQGLFCDQTTTHIGSGGTCKYDEDDGSCEIDGKTYTNGEVFQPSCKMQCRCIDGGATCTPLCSDEVHLPTSECPLPRRLEIPGKCCPQWICDGQENKIPNVVMTDLRYQQVPPQSLFYPCEEWSTEWSACSTTCGMGTSLRVTNKNHHCKLETQSRLCMVRPCEEFGSITHYRLSRCKPTVSPAARIHFEFPNCVSVRAYHPTFCGFCGGRQCIPYQTSEEPVDFNCNGGRLVRKKMMFIVSCVCH
ncbi:CCN family member 5 [Ambystoma mexicanum]|uniref:CCN family member 5 n=1 Tax=Ambystoma mexicanum TaxID=8296 RepID=UPI0037E7ADA0